MSHVVSAPAAAPSASKAAALRAEAAKTIAAWKASRSISAAAKAPASVAPSAEPIPSANPSLDLAALFDGALPTSREVLARAEALGLHHRELALAISGSKSPSNAAARLTALGVLGAHEAVLTEPYKHEFLFVLNRLWRKTAPSVPAPFAVDDSFGVPALKVERDGTTYFVHAVTHGELYVPRRWAVLSLVRRVSAAGHALYSEQNLPAFYGYKKGRETLDHAAATGAPAAVVPAAENYTSTALFFKCAIDWLVIPFTVLAGLPLMRRQRRLLAAQARAQGLEDIAEQYADEAQNFFNAKPDLETLRGLELPQPLGTGADGYSVRSRAIADAVAADAAVAGAATVHLIVGSMHAHEVAWRLAEGPRKADPKSQIS